MAKKQAAPKKPLIPNPVKFANPPLHVELSDEANAQLHTIRDTNGWNKKTAVERIIHFFHAKHMSLGGAE